MWVWHQQAFELMRLGLQGRNKQPGAHTQRPLLALFYSSGHWESSHTELIVTVPQTDTLPTPHTHMSPLLCFCSEHGFRNLGPSFAQAPRKSSLPSLRAHLKCHLSTVSQTPWRHPASPPTPSSLLLFTITDGSLAVIWFMSATSLWAIWGEEPATNWVVFLYPNSYVEPLTPK